MHLITGKLGTDHITSANDGFRNSMIFGRGSYVFDTDEDLYARAINNNTVRISKGQGCIQGRLFENIEETDLTIISGTTALKRIDLIVARYERNPNNDLESIRLEVITGQTSVDVPDVPAHIEGNIYNRDLIADFPLYKVNVDGLEIVSVEPMFELTSTIEEKLQGKVDNTTDGAIGLITKLSTSTAEMNDSTYMIVGGTTYIRKKITLLWNYIKSKILSDADVNPDLKCDKDMFISKQIHIPEDVTLNAGVSGSRTSVDIQISGYTPLAVRAQNTGNTTIIFHRFYINSTNLVFWLRNTGTTTQTATSADAYVTVLYGRGASVGNAPSAQSLDDDVVTSKK